MSATWWVSPGISIAFSIPVLFGAGVSLFRERRHLRHEQALERTIRERTEELNRERRTLKERNSIMEMLVSNEALGTVLDAIVRMISAQATGAVCAVLLRHDEGCRIAASTDSRREWLAALQSPHTVPIEIWQKPLWHEDLSRDPAWKPFTRHLNGCVPNTILSWPIANPEISLGVLLLCYPPGTQPGERDSHAAEIGARLVRLAVEHNRFYDDLHFQAHHDVLTGLPNRILFEERLDRSLHEAAVLGQRLAVLFIDLDHFKEINDTLSHRIGDQFLCEVATRIRKALRPGDTVARMGGDEFTVVVNDLKNPREAAEIAARIHEAVRVPIVIDGRELAAGASIGIAVYPDDAKEAEQLQRAADAAMYSAKGQGRDRIQAFASRNDFLDRVRMDEELREALKQGYFAVHYQPKVGVTGELAGLEALIRIKHPRHGLIPPGSFISVAETNGMIVPIGAWVLDEVCRQIAEWESRGLGQISVAVNVSPVQIGRTDFAKTVEACLAQYRVSPRNLELELTESTLVTETEAAQRQIQALRALGVRFSIDDFGSGYSSLSYLHRLNVDSIKLDRSFIQSIDTDQLARGLVQAMIGVAKSLGLNVVAEGVETESQREVLIAMGCPLMQGFLFARPRPAAELESLFHPAPGTAKTAKDLLQLQMAGETVTV
jgi:diguanylate cyclase (GGDEF)-like protein